MTCCPRLTTTSASQRIGGQRGARPQGALERVAVELGDIRQKTIAGPGDQALLHFDVLRADTRTTRAALTQYEHLRLRLDRDRHINGPG